MKCSTRNSGLAMMPNQPQSTIPSSLGFTWWSSGELLRPEIDSELIACGAADRNSGIGVFGAVDRRRDDVVVSRGLKRSVRRRQEGGREILIVDAREREYAVRVDGAIFRRLSRRSRMSLFFSGS